MIIRVGALGNLIQGHVLDVNKNSFERTLKDYDELLYVKWNPKKLKGHGCWEIRRRPEYKSVVDAVKVGNVTISRLEYCEVDLVNHVLDCAFLNYDQLNKIKSMDTTNTNQKFFVDELEHREAVARQLKQDKAIENRRYMAKQYKREIADFKEFVAAGNSPDHAISQYWGNK
jgi:hypothetical protein